MDKQMFKKEVNLKLARELALQATHAEWGKDFKVAAEFWGLAHKVCSVRGETWCKNRRDTCQRLSTRDDLEVTMVSRIPSIFEALKF